MANPTAVMRWAGEITSRMYEPSVGAALLVFGASVAPMLAEGVDEGELGKRNVGRAIRITPKRETRAAICSIRVKASWMRREHAQQATMGARKARTVASAIGRYIRESVSLR